MRSREPPRRSPAARRRGAPGARTRGRSRSARRSRRAGRPCRSRWAAVSDSTLGWLSCGSPHRTVSSAARSRVGSIRACVAADALHHGAAAEQRRRAALRGDDVSRPVAEHGAPRRRRRRDGQRVGGGAAGHREDPRGRVLEDRPDDVVQLGGEVVAAVGQGGAGVGRRRPRPGSRGRRRRRCRCAARSRAQPALRAGSRRPASLRRQRPRVGEPRSTQRARSSSSATASAETRSHPSIAPRPPISNGAAPGSVEQGRRSPPAPPGPSARPSRWRPRPCGRRAGTRARRTSSSPRPAPPAACSRMRAASASSYAMGRG